MSISEEYVAFNPFWSGDHKTCNWQIVQTQLRLKAESPIFCSFVFSLFRKEIFYIFIQTEIQVW